MLPIVAFGHPTLRKISQDIDQDYPELNTLIEAMFETMYKSVGVGLAAPQINKNIRLFVIDASPYADEVPETKDFKKIFINAKIIEEDGEEWGFTEGCLSIPDIHEEVFRHDRIRIQYYDENFEPHDEVYDGIRARIIQHEYDHLEGKVFIDHISNMRRMLIKRRLNDIINGDIKVGYRMIFTKLKKKVK